MTEGYQQRSQPSPNARSTNDTNDGGIAALLAGLLKDLQELVRGEVKLARTEIQEDLSHAGRGVAMLAAGALVGLTGFIFLMLAVTYALNKRVEMWIAAGIVGVTLAVIAAIAASMGRKQLSAGSLKPTTTIESIKEDKEWASQQISSVKR